LEQYRKALPWLNVLSEDPRKVDRSEVDERLEAQKSETKVLKREVKMRRLLDNLRLTELLEKLEKD